MSPWGTLIALALLAGIAAADPLVHLTPAQRAQFKALRAHYSGHWNGYSGVEPDPENARLFLALCEEATEVPEICSAISAADLLYSANPSAGSSYNGKRYQRLLVDEDFKNVCRHLLQHPNAKVRENAATSMARNCIWGNNPDVSLFPLLVSAYDREPDANSRRNILFTFGACHANSKAVGDMFLRGLRDVNSRILNAAVSQIALRYRRGTDYGPEFRRQAGPLIRKQLQAPEQDTRYEAYSCLVEMTPPEQRRMALVGLLREGLRDKAGGVVGQVMLMIEESKATALLPDVVEHLSDTRPARLYAESMVDPGGTPGWSGDQTPVQHFALRTLAVLSADLLGARGYLYRYQDKRDGDPIPKDLSSQAAQARAWVKANQAALNQALSGRS